MSRIIQWLTSMLLLCAAIAHAQIIIHHEYFVGGAPNCDFADIATAVTHANAGDFVYIAPSSSAYDGHLSITKSLNLIGTNACGNDIPPPASAPFATISGAGGADAPVVAIGGTGDVFISGLEITGGHAGPNGYGGGIDFSGAGGSLTLSNVVLDVNSAKEGGGLAITPVGTAAPNIYINDDVQFLVNTAFDSGAGMYISGRSEVLVMGKRDLIALNTAATSGGGIFIRSPARVALGSPGLNGLLIYDNSAQYGGGIAGYAGDGERAFQAELVSLFTTDAASPGQILANRASVAGGGVYLKGRSGGGGSGNFASLCAMDFRINQNSAPQGAALHLENDDSFGGTPVSSAAYLNTAQCGSAADFHAVGCAPDIPCNEISGNTAVDVNNHPSNGAVVFLAGGDGGGVQAQRLVMHGNRANYLFQSSDEFSAVIQLSEFLTGANTLSSEMFRMEGGNNILELRQSTLAPDIVNSTHAIKFDQADSATYLTLLDSIIDEPGTLTLNYPGNVEGNLNINTGFLLSNDITTLPHGVNNVQGTPLFVDDSNANVDQRNYRLRAYVQNGHVTASPGIDFAPTGDGGGTDMDGNHFDKDVLLVPNFAGAHDIGAYEAQPIADRIFADAFGDATSLVY